MPGVIKDGYSLLADKPGLGMALAQAVFHTEKAAVYEAGLRRSLWQQLEDTLREV